MEVLTNRVGNALLYIGGDYRKKKSLPRDSYGFEPLEGYLERNRAQPAMSDSSSDSDDTEELIRNEIERRRIIKAKTFIEASQILPQPHTFPAPPTSNVAPPTTHFAPPTNHFAPPVPQFVLARDSVAISGSNLATEGRIDLTRDSGDSGGKELSDVAVGPLVVGGKDPRDSSDSSHRAIYSPEISLNEASRFSPPLKNSRLAPSRLRFSDGESPPKTNTDELEEFGGGDIVTFGDMPQRDASGSPTVFTISDDNNDHPPETSSEVTSGSPEKRRASWKRSLHPVARRGRPMATGTTARSGRRSESSTGRSESPGGSSESNPNPRKKTRKRFPRGRGKSQKNALAKSDELLVMSDLSDTDANLANLLWGESSRFKSLDYLEKSKLKSSRDAGAAVTREDAEEDAFTTASDGEKMVGGMASKAKNRTKGTLSLRGKPAKNTRKSVTFSQSESTDAEAVPQKPATRRRRMRNLVDDMYEDMGRNRLDPEPSQPARPVPKRGQESDLSLRLNVTREKIQKLRTVEKDEGEAADSQRDEDTGTSGTESESQALSNRPKKSNIRQTKLKSQVSGRGLRRGKGSKKVGKVKKRAFDVIGGGTNVSSPQKSISMAQVNASDDGDLSEKEEDASRSNLHHQRKSSSEDEGKNLPTAKILSEEETIGTIRSKIRHRKKRSSRSNVRTSLPRREPSSSQWFVPDDSKLSTSRRSVLQDVKSSQQLRSKSSDLSVSEVRGEGLDDPVASEDVWGGVDDDNERRASSGDVYSFSSGDENGLELTVTPGGRKYRRLEVARPPPRTPGVRRSKRARIAPVRRWENEQAEYDMRRQSGIMLTGVLVPYKDENETVDKKKKKNVVDDDSYPPYQYNDNLGNVTSQKVVHTLASAYRLNAVGGVAEDNTGVVIHKTYASSHTSNGVITFSGLAEKERCNTETHDMFFYVTKGKLLFTLGEQDYEIGPNQAVFHVPSGGAAYSIKNLQRSRAEVFFTVNKAPI